MPANSRLLQERNVCSIAKKTKNLQGKVEYAAMTLNEILHNVEEKARHKVFENVDLSVILQQEIESVQVCQESRKAAAGAAKASEEMLCDVSSQLRLPTKSLLRKVEMESQMVMEASSRAMHELALIRQAQRQMNTMYYLLDARKHQELQWRGRGIRRRSPAPLPFGTQDLPFGIQDLFLVDAKKNQNIAVIGSRDCAPLNKCFGKPKRLVMFTMFF